MRMQKWSVVLLSVVLTLTVVLAGCSSSSNSNNNQPPAQQPGSSDGAGSNQDNSADDSRELVQLSVASMPKEAPNSIPNEYITQVEERFNMKWDFEVIPLSAGMEKYNVMFASGDYPDFIPNMNSPSSVARWASAGFLLPIGDYIDRMPTYRSLFSDEDWELLLSFASTDGKLYMLPNVASNDPMTWIYRKDAFDKAGITSFPQTMDELYEALKTLKAAYPDSVGIGVRGGTDTTGIRNLMNGFRQAFRNPNNTNTRGFWNDPDAGNEVVWNMASEKHREMLSFIGKLYKEGLVEKEFATLTQDQWKAKRLNGQVLIDFQWSSHTVDPGYELKDIPGGEWDYARTLPAAYEGEALEFSPLNFALFGPIFSSKLKNEPEKLDRLIEYIEWGATPEGQLFHQMGLEDVTYEVKDGVISYKEGFDRAAVSIQYGFDWWLKQSDDFLKSNPVHLKKVEAMEAMKAVFNTTPKSASMTEEEQQTINTTVSAMEDVAYQFATRAAMGLIDLSNDNVWNTYLDDLKKVGMENALNIYKKYLE